MDWKKLLTGVGIVGTGTAIGYFSFKTKKSPILSAGAKTTSASLPTASTASAQAQAAAAQSASPFADFPKAATVTTQSDPLNVRSSPSTSATVVAKAPKGSQVSITGPSVSAGGLTWAPIKTSDGQSGFASTQYLKAS